MDPFTRRELLTLAATQQSLFTVGQAAALGITPGAFRKSARSGWVRRVRVGVYAVEGHEPSPRERLDGRAVVGEANDMEIRDGR